MAKLPHVTLVVKNKTADQWKDFSGILKEGQLGLETDTGKMKAGNGVDLYSDLPYLYLSADETQKLIGDLNALPSFTIEDAGKSIVVSEDGTKYELKMITDNQGSYPIGDGLKIVDGKLTVDVVHVAEEDNTKPITSGAVFTTVGNIDALLQTI